MLVCGVEGCGGPFPPFATVYDPAASLIPYLDF